MEDIKRLKICIPKLGSILLVNLVSGFVLMGFLMLLRAISGLLLRVIDRPAFTSGDLPYLLRSWQGILVVIIGIAVLFVYVAIDLNVDIVLSKAILENKKIRLPDIIKQAFANLKYLFCPAGVLIILFITFITPLFGGAIGISLTSSFRIPDFILTVIHSKPLFYIGYWLLVVAAMVAETIHIFMMHYVNIEHMKPKEALRAARKMFVENKKEFFFRMIPFALLILSAIAVILILFVAIPISVFGKVNMNRTVFRFLILMILGIGGVVFFLSCSALGMAFTMELTVLFEEFRGNHVETDDVKVNTLFVKRGAIAALIIIVIAAVVQTANFDAFFPEYSDESLVIAHRGAGDLANENTVQSINLAYDIDADVSEIDIHRTKDGEYILNHDADFKRLTGDPRTPQEMTVEEIKKLRMNDGSQIATLNEILDAAKGKVHLYIELKGASADRQMVDDVYRKLVEKDMLKQCSLISLDYEEIEYAETTYPEVDTVYLLYFGFGNMEQLKCDSLGLEQETATEENVQKVQAAGKRVDVWTCNTVPNLLSAVRNGADGIITDKPHVLNIIKLAEGILDTDFLRVMNVVLPKI